MGGQFHFFNDFQRFVSRLFLKVFVTVMNLKNHYRVLYSKTSLNDLYVSLKQQCGKMDSHLVSLTEKMLNYNFDVLLCVEFHIRPYMETFLAIVF